MNIVIAADHGGVELKELVKKEIEEMGHSVNDVGCFGQESVDYPDYAEKAVTALKKSGDLAILICGTGIGMSIAANRSRFVRAALCHNEFTAQMSREHNDANVLCLGARVLETEVALQITRTWLNTDFAGGRHLQRISKFSDL